MTEAIEKESTRCFMRALAHVPDQYHADAIRQWSIDHYWRTSMYFAIEQAQGWANAEAPLKYRPIHTSIIQSLRVDVSKKIKYV